MFITEDLTFIAKRVHSVLDVLLRVLAVETRTQFQHALRRQRQIVAHQLHVIHDVSRLTPASDQTLLRLGKKQ